MTPGRRLATKERKKSHRQHTEDKHAAAEGTWRGSAEEGAVRTDLCLCGLSEENHEKLYGNKASSERIDIALRFEYIASHLGESGRMEKDDLPATTRLVISRVLTTSCKVTDIAVK